jgi:hypothetical protein
LQDLPEVCKCGIAGQYDTAMLHYTKDAFNAEACQMADEESTRWVGR